ncbi:MAG: glycosyltransferase family 87 protein [Agriterribacter sp.]
MVAATVKKYLRSGEFLYNKKLAAILWFGLSLIAVLQKVNHGKLNNFEVYRHVYFHVLQKVNLYVEYPAEYGDVNLYGPVFSLIIAPFALLPAKIGVICWVMCNVLFLYFAIYKLPINSKWKTALVLLCSHEMMNASSWLQSNAMVCSCILLSFVYTLQNKEYKALFFIMMPTFVKLYGVVSLAFIFFSKRPWKFVAWGFIWFGIFFIAPLLLTNFSFLIQCYQDWYAGLQIKAAKNIRLDTHYYYQDISMMGIIRRTVYPQLNDAVVLISGAILMISQFVYHQYFSNPKFRLYILSSLLLFVVIFSTGSESPTYIIALPGICLWYLLQPSGKFIFWFFIFAFVLTTFSYSDMFTPWLRAHIIKPYSLKALPACIIWITIVVQIHRKQFLQARNLVSANDV